MRFKRLASDIFRRATGLALVNPQKYDISLKARAQANAPSAQAPSSKNPTPRKFVPVASFAEARAQSGAGYNDQRLLARAYLSPHAYIIGMQDYTAPMLAAFAAAGKRTNSNVVRVLDVGGGTGVFRAQVNDFFEERFKTDWTVLEAEEAVRFNEDVESDDFRYRSTLGADHFDIALFCGSLQYIENYQDMLRRVNADLVFISRTPIGARQQAFVQHMTTAGEEFRLPAQILAKDDLVGALSPNYALFAQWNAQSHLLDMGIFESPTMIWRRQ